MEEICAVVSTYAEQETKRVFMLRLTIRVVASRTTQPCD